MKSLIIDTSHNISYVILAKNHEIIFLKKIEKTKLSKDIFKFIDYILKKNNTKISDLKYIAASVGPGSFTGLRVGATICKTISYANKIPLIGYISFEAYTPSNPGKYLSVFDAKSEGVYVIEGILDKDQINYSFKPQLFSNEEAKKTFDNHHLIISPDAEILKNKFNEHKNKFNLCLFNPSRLVNLTENLFQNKEFTDYNDFNLLYLRGPNPY